MLIILPLATLDISPGWARKEIEKAAPDIRYWNEVPFSKCIVEMWDGCHASETGQTTAIRAEAMSELEIGRIRCSVLNANAFSISQTD